MSGVINQMVEHKKAFIQEPPIKLGTHPICARETLFILDPTLG
jgi:hypothetical protein